MHTESTTLQFSDGATHTIKDPGPRRNAKEYTFQKPAISVRPQLAGRHGLLTPPFSTSKNTSSTLHPGHTAGSYLTRHCMASWTGSQMNPTVTALSFLEGLIQAKPPLKPFC